MPAADLHSPPDVFARTIWAEARSEGRAGMEAVACVILNRAKNPGWWGGDVRSVCLAPAQFSCWNASDPQAHAIRGDLSRDALFPTCCAVAQDALVGGIVDRTGGADS